MGSRIDPILRLEVPIIVVLATRSMTAAEVTALIPGAIIELPKSADEELELRVNNKTIGVGRAVKVGENFGLRLTFIGDVRDRIQALGGNEPAPASPADAEAEALAEAMLQGQI